MTEASDSPYREQSQAARTGKRGHRKEPTSFSKALPNTLELREKGGRRSRKVFNSISFERLSPSRKTDSPSPLQLPQARHPKAIPDARTMGKWQGQGQRRSRRYGIMRQQEEVWGSGKDYRRLDILMNAFVRVETARLQVKEVASSTKLDGDSKKQQLVRGYFELGSATLDFPFPGPSAT